MNKDYCSAFVNKIINDFDHILLLPHDDNRLNSLLAASFIAKIGDKQGVVIKGNSAKEIIKLYSLYAFTDKLIIGSFDLPYGRKLRNLLDSGIATEETLINNVILRGLS